MLSIKGTTVISGAVLVLALSVPAVAQRPIAGDPAPAVSYCEDIRQDILYYYGLFQKGGTIKQMEVWKKRYKTEMWNWGRSKCGPLYKKIGKRLVDTDKEPNKAQPKTAITTS